MGGNIMVKINNNCEVITVSLLKSIDKAIQKGETVAINMATDEEFQSLYGRKPLKNEDDRLQLALPIKGVENVVCGKKIQTKPLIPKSRKKYNVGYVPGTYDLLHMGHIENIAYARKLCKTVIVAVNSDKLVYDNKQKY